MQLLIIWCLIVIGLFIKGFYDKKTNDKIRMERLKREWGEVPKEEYNSLKFASLKHYYNAVKDGTKDIDDITWNDLDMDQVYMLMNNTSSAIGEEYLYAVLHQLVFSEEELKERSRLIQFFEEKEEKRLKLQAELSKMGKLRNLSVYEYINMTDTLDNVSSVKHYLLCFGLLFSIVGIFFQPAIFGLLTVLFLSVNITQYFRRKAVVEPYFTVFSYILRLLDSAQQIAKLSYDELQAYTSEIHTTAQAFTSFKKGAFWVVSGSSMTGSLLDTFLDYARMLFHIDLIKFNSLLRSIRENRTRLNQMFITIGYLDSLIAVASFRELMGDYCEPELSRGGKPRIDTMDAYHPMLNDPVKNSLKESKSVLITGSNASGKSTFIKTLAINAILAQTVYTCLCAHYRGSYFKVYTSMALRDDIFSNESYYIVEIKSLKRILNQLGDEFPVLCFVDEVLRGTNTLERIAASSQILKSLASSNSLCFAATHDIELTQILERYFSNYHFREQVVEEDILFDYKIHSGKAVSRNAIKLLGIMGYSKDIIHNANKSASEFLADGQWRALP